MEEKEQKEASSCTFRPEVHMYTISEGDETASMKRKKRKRENLDVFGRL
jgi:hypothetical protein